MELAARTALCEPVEERARSGSVTAGRASARETRWSNRDLEGSKLVGRGLLEEVFETLRQEGDLGGVVVESVELLGKSIPLASARAAFERVEVVSQDPAGNLRL